jgi:hypothetical protein
MILPSLASHHHAATGTVSGGPSRAASRPAFACLGSAKTRRQHSSREDYLVGVIVVISGDSKLMDELFTRLP